MAASSDLLAKLIAEHPELLKRGGAFHRREVHESAEWHRVCALPRRELDLTLIPDLSPLWATGSMSLWPIQSAALLEAEAVGGLFAILPVGAGKTLLAALLPEAMGAKSAVILVPAQSKKKKATRDYPELAKSWRLPPATLVSYTELERAPGDVLERLQPDVVIVDEAHCLKNREAARTVRFLRYFKERPATKLAVMSGTLTRKGLNDYAHLIRLALKDRCPVPRDYMTLTEWAEALDTTDNPRPPGALLRLCELKEHQHASNARDTFACRIRSTPGVVAAPEGFKGPLTLRRIGLEPPPKVAAALDRLRKSWLVGDPQAPEEAAEEITDDLSYARYLRQLSLGFYLRWLWPSGSRDTEWLAARSGWSSVVRHVLRYCRRPGLDSPLLVANAARRGELCKEHQGAWEEWQRVSDRKQPPTVPVWIDPYVVTFAAEWALSNAGVVFFEHRELGIEIAKKVGVKLPEHATDIVMDGRPQVLSLHRFRQDLDGLQRVYHRCLYTSLPNAEWLEQSLGRLHREGQTKRVEADLLLPIPESLDWLETVRTDAERIEETGFGQQKLLYAVTEGIDLDGH